MTSSALGAVLWDMDGTLVDTEPHWIAGEHALFRRYGLEWTHDDSLRMVGLGLWDAAEYMRAKGIPLTADEIVWELVGRVADALRESVPWRPGARELVLDLQRQGVPQAIVTMSVRVLAEIVAASLDSAPFALVVPGDEVTNPKPHPEPYEKAARLLGVDPRAAVAFEDSPPGVASAHSAGTIAIGVPNIVSLDDTVHHELWPTLAGRTAADVLATHERWTTGRLGAAGEAP